MSSSNLQFAGWTAIIGGIVGVVGFISLVLLFVVGEPFGSLNDFLSIPTAFLMLPLVVALYRLHAPHYPVASLLALVVGVAGFLTTATGSTLLLLNRIDFQQSLLPGIGGFGLIGLWVLINSVLGLAGGTLPRGIAWAGLLLSLTPAVALVFMLRPESVASALSGMAGQATAGFQMNPFVAALFALGALSYAVMPIWFIMVGRLFALGKLGFVVGAVAAS